MCKNLDPNDTNLIKKDEFLNVLFQFKLPQRLIQDNVIDPMILEFTDKNQPDKINYKNFIEHVADYKELNDFYNFKDKHLIKIEDKIVSSKNKMVESLVVIKEEESKKHKMLKELEKNLKLFEEQKNKLKEKENNADYEKQTNNCQPSKEFNDRIFKDRGEIKQKIIDIESKFSAHPSLRKEIKAKTRYGANPDFKDTHWITNQDPKSGMFVNERDRFGQNKTCFQTKEKEIKTQNRKSKIDIIKFYADQKENTSRMSQMLYEQKKNYSLMQRTEKIYRYEKINKTRNELIE